MALLVTRTRACHAYPFNQALAPMFQVGLFLEDLADRFNTNVSTLSKIFNAWIYLMDRELAPVNASVQQRFLDVVVQSPPVTELTNVRCIIDCTELSTERPWSLCEQNQKDSSYKHDATIKFLVAILPTGGICFVSRAWDGKVSDRHIIEKCGFLDMVNPGDLIMADKRFTISDLLAKKFAFLHVSPPLLNEQPQFKSSDINDTCDITEARLRVERTLDEVKRFRILDPVIPISLYATVSSVFRVCCFISSLNPSLDT